MKFFHNEIDKKVLMVANADGVFAIFVNGVFESEDDNIIKQLKECGFEFETPQAEIIIETEKKARKKK